MKNQYPRYFVFTGGPGAGKTTVLAALAKLGYITIPESGRKIIQDQMNKNGNVLPWKDNLAFANDMLTLDMENHNKHLRLEKPILFDRGVLDSIGHLLVAGIEVPLRFQHAAFKYRYQHDVFFFPPWQAIYKQDKERKQHFELAVKTFQIMKNLYEKNGYRPIEVPFGSITERTDFVLQHMKAKE